MKLTAKRYTDSILGYFLVFLLTIPAKALGLILKRDHGVGKKEPSAILVIKILGLGSVLMAGDSLLAIKKRYPGAKLILLCGKGVKAGMEPAALFDEIWTSDDRSFFHLIRSGLSCLFRTWRTRNLWVIDLEVYSKLTTVFATLTCAHNRFGFYLNEVWFRYNLNTHNIYFNQFCPVELNYKALAEAAGATVSDTFYIGAYRSGNRPSAFGYIAVNNTCSELGTERRMPDTILKDVCEGLLSGTNMKIALLGAPSDRADNEAFLKQYLPDETRILNMAGALSFSEYYSFLHGQCALMLTIDSAPLHISRKLGVPTLSLWGPTNPDTRINSSGQDKIYYLHVPCSPCVHHTEILPCGGDNFCMKRMEAAVIISMACSQLKTA